MTKEVAEKIVKGITDKIECNTVDIDDWAEFWGFTRGEYEEFLDMAIKASEQELKTIEDKQAESEKYQKAFDDGYKNGYAQARFDYEQDSKTEHCKDCKYFEYDSVAKVDGIPLIVAHEICNKWGNGCKSREDGYCFLFEEKKGEEK